MNENPTLFMYLASALGAAVAISLLVRGEPAPAAVVAVGVVFLIYWARRQDREGGDG